MDAITQSVGQHMQACLCRICVAVIMAELFLVCFLRYTQRKYFCSHIMILYACKPVSQRMGWIYGYAICQIVHIVWQYCKSIQVSPHTSPSTSTHLPSTSTYLLLQVLFYIYTYSTKHRGEVCGGGVWVVSKPWQLCQRNFKHITVMVAWELNSAYFQQTWYHIAK